MSSCVGIFFVGEHFRGVQSGVELFSSSPHLLLWAHPAIVSMLAFQFGNARMHSCEIPINLGIFGLPVW